MSETIDKPKLVEWLLHSKSWRSWDDYVEVTDAIQSGTFNSSSNHLREALELFANRDNWKVNVSTYTIEWIGEDEPYSVAQSALNTSVTEPSVDRVILRPEVQWFAEQMELALQANEDKLHWSKCHEDYLLEKLYLNAGKLAMGEDKERRTVNIGNFAMMIADNARRQ